MARFFRNNGLTIVLLLLFLGSIIGHWLTGWQFKNEELARHGEVILTLGQYSTDPNFLATIFENWESEFLQMSTYVILTAFLFQKGSAESNDPDEAPRDQNLDQEAKKRGASTMLRWGRTARWLYAHSLGIAMLFLFVASFLLHWKFSADEAAGEAISHGATPLGMADYLWEPQLWFESFQNWQSEFLSTAVLVVLTIYLRQKNSPESKPVAASHDHTGAE
ncbi:MAG: hypothetical protein H0W74_07625 [Sphingosinicella sp.]|nr:hypothetical protein [Sphingosinicella sp.]